MASLKIRVDDEEYEIDPENLTLGESFLLESDYGLDVSEPLRGAAGLIGLLVIALRRADPKLTKQQARERVEALTDERIEVIQEKEQDPTPAATGKAGGKTRASGKEGRTPAKSGTRG